MTGDPVNTDRYSLAFTTNFSNMALTSGTQRVLVDGDLTIAASQNGSSATSVGLSGSRLSMSVVQSGTAANTYTLADFNLGGTETGSTTTLAGNYTLSGTSAKLGAYAYRVQTERPIVVSGSRSSVSAGSVLITGSPATVTATALDGTTMRLEYSARGDGVITATSSLTRAQFDALD